MSTPTNETALATRKAELMLGAQGFEMPTVEAAIRFANCLIQAGLAPQAFKSPQAIVVAIQAGREVGLSPMAALRGFCVVKGQPKLYGQVAKGLALASGLVAEWDSWFEADGKKMDRKVSDGPPKDNWTAVWCITRKGMKPMQARFSVDDAKRAGLWKDNGDAAWHRYAKDMLLWKAFHRAADNTLGDVFCGLLADDVPEATPKHVGSSAMEFPPEDDPLLTQQAHSAVEIETPGELNAPSVMAEPSEFNIVPWDRAKAVAGIQAKLEQAADSPKRRELLARKAFGVEPGDWPEMPRDAMEDGELVIDQFAASAEMQTVVMTDRIFARTLDEAASKAKD